MIEADPMKRMVAKAVRDHIFEHKTLPNDAKHALRDSHHFTTLVTKLTVQYKAVQDIQRARGKKLIADKTLIDTTKDFTEYMIAGFLGHIEQRSESDLQKAARKEATDNVAEMDKALQGESSGVFEDMGLVIPEDQQEQTENHIKEPVKDGRIINIGK